MKNKMTASLKKIIRNPRLAPWIFLSPYIILSAVFFLYPFINAVSLAFHQTHGIQSKIFVGLSNFSFILNDSIFHKALINTTVFALCSIFIQLPISLGLALLLNSGKGLVKNFFRLLIFSPHLVGQIFAGVMFSIMFLPKYGLVNRVIYSVTGLGWFLDQNWLQNASMVMPALVLTSMWMYIGLNMIYFLAALQNVDKTLVESARIDGASPIGVFWNVTIPSIKPVAIFVVILSTIGSFQLFELPLVLLGGMGQSVGSGPDNSGLTVVAYLYQYGFLSGDLGIGASVGWVLTLIIFIISLVQIRLLGRED